MPSGKAKSKKPGEHFNPHQWEGCYVFRCHKSTCPYIADCFGAQKMDQKKTEAFIEDINQKLSKGTDVSKLSPLERMHLDHAVEKHGARFDSEKGTYYINKEVLKKRIGLGAVIYK